MIAPFASNEPRARTDARPALTSGIKRKTIVSLRGVLLVAAGALMLQAGALSAGSAGVVLLSLHALSSGVLLAAPLRWLHFQRLELTVGLLDVAFIVAAVYLAGAGAGVLPVSCLILALVLALADCRAHRVAGTVVGCALHAWLGLARAGTPVIQLLPELLFVATLGLYLGYLARDLHRQRRRTEAERLGRTRMETLLDIHTTINSSLDLAEVTRIIVDRVGKVVHATRCSMVFIEPDGSGCRVIASSDDPALHRLEIDLKKYPEIREAIATGSPVIIDSADDDPRLAEVRRTLAGLDVKAIVIIPLTFGEDVLGTLCLRASRTRHEFTPREVEFCSIVARACANALKNALLHRRALEEAGRHSQLSRKLAMILHNSPELMLAADGDGRITEINPAAELLLGRRRADLLGQDVRSLLHEEDAEEISQRLDAQDTVANRVCSLRREDGGVIQVELNLAPLRDEDGSIEGSVWLARDVTELRDVQTQLLQAKKLSTVGEVVSGVAHELNNPLSGVLGFSELLLLRDVDERMREELEMIHDSALRCQRIVRNLLSFARENPPERRSHAVDDIVRQTLEMKQYQLRTSNIELECNLDPGLPPSLIDFGQLQQVLLHLIGNAQQAIERARRPAGSRLVVRTLLCDSRIRIEVSDNGEGMSQETLERVFDPFFTTKRPGAGTGLGLSVSYGIVKRHGGRIWARSRPDKGALFVVELPVHRGAERADDTCERVSVGRVRTGSRILVVDDEPVVLQFFVDLFEGRGYKVDTALNGRQACEELALRSYDLVVTDICMPEMDGVELYPRMLSRRPELEGRVIFITGNMADGKTSRFVSESKVPTLEKPIEVRRVVRIVDETLARPNLSPRS